MKLPLKKIVRALIVSVALSATATTSVLANTEVCEASWYGPGFHGNLMANGKRFNSNDRTVVAHKSLPFGTKLLITNLNNNQSIKVVVQDRGPFTRGRCVDVSRTGAQALGFYCGETCGTAPVSITILN